MTPKQKYLFDLTGYLHLKNVLTAEELSRTQTAIDHLLSIPTNQLPSGIQRSSEGFSNAFSFDESLQALTGIR